MVKGNESLVVCSYTWLRETPRPVEISRVRSIGRLLSKHHTKMYADVLDPHFDKYADHTAVIQNSTVAMSAAGIWLAVVANDRKNSFIAAEAAVAVGRGMQIVLGCQDEFADSVPGLERHAVENGRVFYWGNDAELLESVEDVLLPMCDNRRNDINTIWTNQRKTA